MLLYFICARESIWYAVHLVYSMSINAVTGNAMVLPEHIKAAADAAGYTTDRRRVAHTNMHCLDLHFFNAVHFV